MIAPSTAYRLLIFLLLPFILNAKTEEKPPIPFQVFLWPGAPNPELEAKLRNHKTKDNEDTIVEYVSPTIQFSPDGGIEVESISAAERRLSPTYYYSGNSPLVLFKEKQTSDGSTHRQILGSVNIPDHFERALLLLLPHPKNKEAYLIYPIENSLNRVPPGHANIQNISTSRIGCLFNHEQLILESGQQKAVPVGSEQSVYIAVRIGSEEDDGEWKERYAEQLFVNPEDSFTILVYNRPGKPHSFRIMQIKNPIPEAANQNISAN